MYRLTVSIKDNYSTEYIVVEESEYKHKSDALLKIESIQDNLKNEIGKTFYAVSGIHCVTTANTFYGSLSVYRDSTDTFGYDYIFTINKKAYI